MIVRREVPADLAAIFAVHCEAFERPDAPGEVPSEATLVDNLRACDAWIPELSLVAVVDGAHVGHVVCSRALVAERFPVLGLGPLGVVRAHQRAGVGLALMHAVLGAAEARGEPLVALLGSTDYYPRFGFEPASTHGIAAPEEWYGDNFQVRVFGERASSIRGRFRYAEPFDRL